MAWSRASEKIPDGLSEVPGAEELLKWFGYWPSFHDAEVIALHLNRQSKSLVEIETWELTSEIDSKGYYKLAKTVRVTIALGTITACNLTDFNQQNAIFSLTITRTRNGYKLAFEPAYGLSGALETDSISISIEPMPQRR